MALELSSERVLTKFDFLANQGIIHYGPSTAIPLVDEKFLVSPCSISNSPFLTQKLQFEFRVCPSWSKKPLTVAGKVPSQGKTVKFGPGSDINLSHPHQVIGTINSTHILALNIYPVFRPQYLLLTFDSYRLQTEALDLQDVEASWAFLSAKGGEDYYVMYNCAQEAGCSRNHKHMQILQKPEFTSPENGFRFFPDIEERKSTIEIPYVYFLKYFDQKSMEAIEVWDIYQEVLRKCKKALDTKEDDEDTVCPHNMVLTKDWMLMIPRRTGMYKGVMVNAAGMMGMPTVANEELLAIWKKIGPSKALSEFGVPRNDV
jgi:ATP adenylyltransferase